MSAEKLPHKPEGNDQLMVPLDWYLEALAKQLDSGESPKRKRSTKEQLFNQLLTGVEKRKTKLVRLFINGKLTPPIKNYYQRQVNTATGLIMRTLRIKNCSEVAFDCQRHYWFHYNPASREELGQFRERTVEWGLDKSSMRLAEELLCWENPPNLQSYLERVPAEARELLHLSVALHMLYSETVPAEVRLDNFNS